VENQIDTSKYIIAALNQCPEIVSYTMILAQRSDGDPKALGTEIYNWLEKSLNRGYLLEDQIKASIEKGPLELLTGEEESRMNRYSFYSELLKNLLLNTDSNALGEYYSKKYHEFRLGCNLRLADTANLNPFGFS